MSSVRPIQPEDADALLRFHHRLSPETTRRRFFTFHPEITATELERFTNVDHHDREALVVEDGEEIRAVARYERTGQDEAEFAVVVEDDWQGHGLGTDLLDRTWRLARQRGFHRLWADTLSENRSMLDVFHHAELPMHSSTHAGVTSVTFDLEPRLQEVS